MVAGRVQKAAAEGLDGCDFVDKGPLRLDIADGQNELRFVPLSSVDKMIEPAVIITADEAPSWSQIELVFN
jgi:hypothetical protein